MKPTRKVSAGALAGAVSVVLVWAFNAFGGVTVTPEISSAFTTIVAFFTSYFVPESA